MIIQKKRQLFHVHQIHDASSEWISTLSVVAAFAVDYFQGLLISGISQFQQSYFDFTPSLVTVEDGANLYRKLDMDKVRHVVFSIDPDSVSGLDGFCSKFYQCCWDIINNDLLEVVLDYFRGLVMPKGFQSILLTLLLKKLS